MITLQELTARINPSDPSVEQKVIEPLRLGVISMLEDRTCRLWTRRVGYVHRESVPPIVKNRDQAALWLPLYPVESVTATEHDYGDTEEEAIDAAELDLDAKSGRLVRATGNWGDVVTLTITGGYTEATAPQSVRMALIAQVLFAYSRISPAQIAMASQAFEAGATTYLTPDAHPLFSVCCANNFRRAY